MVDSPFELCDVILIDLMDQNLDLIVKTAIAVSQLNQKLLCTAV